MVNRNVWKVFIPGLLLLGCSPTMTNRENSVSGPHGGATLALPGDQGFAEVVTELDPSVKKAGIPNLAVYFFQADAKSPMSVPPTSAKIKILMPGGSSHEYALTPAPNPKDAAGASRFISPRLKEQTDQLVGELTVTINGQTSISPFNGR